MLVILGRSQKIKKRRKQMKYRTMLLYDLKIININLYQNLILINNNIVFKLHMFVCSGDDRVTYNIIM